MEYNKGSCEVISFSEEKKKRASRIRRMTSGILNREVIDLEEVVFHRLAAHHGNRLYADQSYSTEAFLKDEAALEVVYYGIISIEHALKENNHDEQQIESVRSAYAEAETLSNDMLDAIDAAAEVIQSFDTALYDTIIHGMELIIEKRSNVQ